MDMSSQITIALDAMGGDHAPDLVVEGSDIAITRMPDLKLILVGDRPHIERLIARTKRLARADYEIVHTDQKIGPSDKPSVALRNGRDSSMRLAIDLVGEGRAAGVVSAGNTGALMAMSKLSLRMCPGIKRPAIASFFPTVRGESCMLDLGANIECDADNLVQFAVMGEIFARSILGRERPSVGLLNVGSEEQKGHEELREAADILRLPERSLNFHGFIEGDDITAGTVDVIVTDGFSGNIALKTAEGTAHMVSHYLRQSFASSPMTRLGYLLCRGAIGHMRERLDPRRYNGAVFLGLNGIAVKSHGGTDGFGFASAIGMAADMAKYGFIDRVMAELEVEHAGSVDEANLGNNGNSGTGPDTNKSPDTGNNGNSNTGPDARKSKSKSKGARTSGPATAL